MSRRETSALGQTCDHCPSVLLSFLTDLEASHLARALCYPRLLASGRYDIKSERPLRPVLAGVYAPFVIRSVLLDTVRAHDDPIMLSLLPSTVNSLILKGRGSMNVRVRELPRSLTHFSYHDLSEYDYSSPLQKESIAAEDWPPSLTSLELGSLFLPSLHALPATLRSFSYWRDLHPEFDLPSSLTTLRARSCSRPLDSLPQHLTTLEVPNQVSLEKLPASLTHLTVRGYVSNPGSIKLLSSLRYLCVSSFPLGVLHSLPESLEHLVLDVFDAEEVFYGAARFNQPLRAADLPKLKALTLGFRFNYPLHDLPLSLTELTLDGQSVPYDHDLDHLPPSLTRLDLQRGYGRPLDKLPPSLCFLRLGSPLEHPLDQLPHTLTELCLAETFFNGTLDHLPRQLQVLRFGMGFEQPLDALPNSLTHLDLSRSSSFNRPLDRLPSSLRVLILPKQFDRPLPHLPPMLCELRFPADSCFNQTLDHLPNSVSKLHLGDRFKKPFLRLPRSLTELKLGHRFNHPLPLGPEAPDGKVSQSAVCDQKHPLPYGDPINETKEPSIERVTSLRSLHLGKAFNKPLSLPPSLTSLTIDGPGAFFQPLSISSLPEKLTSLHLPFHYLLRYPAFKDISALRQRCPLVVSL